MLHTVGIERQPVDRANSGIAKRLETESVKQRFAPGASSLDRRAALWTMLITIRR